MKRDREGPSRFDKPPAQLAIDATVSTKPAKNDARDAKLLGNANVAQHRTDVLLAVTKTSRVGTDHHHDFDQANLYTLLDEPVAGSESIQPKRAAHFKPIRTSRHGSQRRFDTVDADFECHA
jgi:hypothetical protein